MASKISPFDLESKFERPTKVYSLIAAHGLYEAMKAAVDLEIFEYLEALRLNTILLTMKSRCIVNMRQ